MEVQAARWGFVNFHFYTWSVHMSRIHACLMPNERIQRCEMRNRFRGGLSVERSSWRRALGTHEGSPLCFAKHPW